MLVYINDSVKVLFTKMCPASGSFVKIGSVNNNRALLYGVTKFVPVRYTFIL